MENIPHLFQAASDLFTVNEKVHPHFNFRVLHFTFIVVSVKKSTKMKLLVSLLMTFGVPSLYAVAQVEPIHRKEVVQRHNVISTRMDTMSEQ